MRERNCVVLNPVAEQLARRLEVLLSKRMFVTAQKVLAEWCEEQESISELDDLQAVTSLVPTGVLKERAAREIIGRGCYTVGDLRRKAARHHQLAGCGKSGIQVAVDAVEKIDRLIRRRAVHGCDKPVEA